MCTTRFCIQDLWLPLLTKRQLEKLSLHLLYYKTNHERLSSLRTRSRLWELVSCGCMEITFPNAAPKWGRCKWLYQLPLFCCSSAFGWCTWGRVGCNTAWNITNILMIGEEAPKFICSEPDRTKHVFSADTWVVFSCGYCDSFFSNNCFTTTGLDRPRVSLCTRPINLFRTFRFPAFIAITFKEKDKPTDTTVRVNLDLFTHSQPRYDYFCPLDHCGRILYFGLRRYL